MKKLLLPLGLSLAIVLLLAFAVLRGPASEKRPGAAEASTGTAASVGTGAPEASSGTESPEAGTGSEEAAGTGAAETAGTGTESSSGTETGSGASLAPTGTGMAETATGNLEETFDENAVCTDEYAPVCGSDGRTYPNACAAARMKVAAVPGSCGKAPEGTDAEDGGTTSGSAPSPVSADRTVTDTGSLTYWNEGVGYGFSFPRGAYYAGFGSRDGATHSVGVGKTAPEDFESSPVKIRLFKGKVLPEATDAQGFATDARGVAYFAVNGSTIVVEGSENFPGILDSIAKSAYVR